MAKAKLLNSAEFANFSSFNFLIEQGKISLNNKGSIMAICKDGTTRKLDERDREPFTAYLEKLEEKLTAPKAPLPTVPLSPSSIEINLNPTDKVNFEEESIPESWNKTWIKLKSVASIEGRGNATKALSAHYWLKIMLSEGISFEIATKALWAFIISSNPKKKAVCKDKILSLQLPTIWEKRLTMSL